MLLNTERLLIRPYKSEDMQDMFEIYSDKKVSKYLLHEETNSFFKSSPLLF